MGIHLPCIENPVLDGNLEFSINDEELALVEFPPDQYTHVPEPAADRRALWRLCLMKGPWLPLWYKILTWAHFGPIDQSADQRERQTYDSQKVWSTLLLRGSRWISLICSIWFYKLLYITDAPPTSRLALKFLFVYSCTEGGFTPIAQKQQQTLSHTCWYFPGWCS